MRQLRGLVDDLIAARHRKARRAVLDALSHESDGYVLSAFSAMEVQRMRPVLLGALDTMYRVRESKGPAKAGASQPSQPSQPSNNDISFAPPSSAATESQPDSQSGGLDNSFLDDITPTPARPRKLRRFE